MTEFIEIACKTCQNILYKKKSGLDSRWSGNCRRCAAKLAHITNPSLLELKKKRATTHGGRSTRLYSIWSGMKDRCINKTSPIYKNYGARDIKICAEWLTDFDEFRSWALSHGYYDSSRKYMQIDRIDNDKGYSPENCRWVTAKENCKNRRNNHYRKYQITQLREAWRLLQIGLTIKKVASILNIGMSTVEFISCGRSPACVYESGITNDDDKIC